MALWELDWLETMEILDVEDYDPDDLLDIAPRLTRLAQVCKNYPKSRPARLDGRRPVARQPQYSLGTVSGAAAPQPEGTSMAPGEKGL